MSINISTQWSSPLSVDWTLPYMKFSDATHTFLPPTADKWYDRFLQRTLGRCLPDIITDVLETEPMDPIDSIAMALRRAADNQKYYKEQIAFLESITEHEEKLEREQEKKANLHRYLHDQPKYLQAQYRYERALEHKHDRWILKEEKDFLKSGLTMDDSDSTIVEGGKRSLMKSFSNASIRLKAIKDEIFEEKRRRSHDRKTIVNPKTFADMMARLKGAHERSALDFLKPKLAAITALGFRKKSDGPRAKKSKATLNVALEVEEKELSDDGSDDSSIYCVFDGDPRRSSSVSSSFSSLPSLPGSPPPERLDHQQLKYERLRATRMIHQALDRGEYVRTKNGLKIRALKSWKRLGLKHKIEKDKGSRCNEHTLMPPVWSEEKFHCQVFYEPEIYTRVPTPDRSSISTTTSTEPDARKTAEKTNLQPASGNPTKNSLRARSKRWTIAPDRKGHKETNLDPKRKSAPATHSGSTIDSRTLELPPLDLPASDNVKTRSSTRDNIPLGSVHSQMTTFDDIKKNLNPKNFDSVTDYKRSFKNTLTKTNVLRKSIIKPRKYSTRKPDSMNVDSYPKPTKVDSYPKAKKVDSFPNPKKVDSFPKPKKVDSFPPLTKIDSSTNSKKVDSPSKHKNINNHNISIEVDSYHTPEEVESSTKPRIQDCLQMLTSVDNLIKTKSGGKIHQKMTMMEKRQD